MKTRTNPCRALGSITALATLLFLVLSAPVRAQDVLMVVANPGALTAGENGVIDRLEGYGFHVVVVDDNAAVTADADGKVLLLMSSTMSSVNVGNTFQSVDVPIVNWEQALQDNFWMTYDGTSDHGETTGQSQIVITPAGAAHPLGAGLAAGVHQVTTSGQTFTWGRPNLDVQAPYCTAIATLNDGNPNHVCIYGYDIGDRLLNGSFTPATTRRVHIFLQDNTFAAVNAAGLQLFDAAIAWALGLTSLELPGIEIVSPTNNTAFAEGADVPIEVDTLSANGTVTNVEFFADGLAIGESDTAPFNLIWSNPPPDRYTLTAKATDSTGLWRTSEAVQITVGDPPPWVLFLVENPAALIASELAIQERLQAFGMDVVLVDDGASIAGDADGKDLVLVSAATEAANIGTKFRNAPVPLISWEEGLQDNQLMTLDTTNHHNETLSQTEILVVNPGHPLAGGLTAGVHTVFTTLNTLTWGQPGPGATVVATLNDGSGSPCLYAYDTGALLVDGATPAPARRVHFLLDHNGFVVLSEAGLRLFDAALGWALGRNLELKPLQITSFNVQTGQVNATWQYWGKLQAATGGVATPDWADVATGGFHGEPAGMDRAFYRVSSARAPEQPRSGPSWDFSHGPLEVSANQRFLVHNDGTPFFYLSDTDWDFFRRARREDAQRLIDKRRQQGFTVLCGPVLGNLDAYYYNDPLGVPNPYGDLPFINKDVTQPATTPGADPSDPDEYDYWDNVDYMVSLAESNGIYVGMMLAWNFHYTADLITEANVRDYARFIGTRYGDRTNIIWVLGGDHNASGRENLFREMAAGIKETEAFEHLMTYHPRGGFSSADWFHTDSWLDFNMLQSGHGSYDIRNDLRIEDDYDLQPVKPTMDGENRYEDHAVGHNPAVGWFSDYDNRQAAYWGLFAGGHGHTYGNRGVWQMCEPDRPRYNPLRYYWYDAMDLPGAWDMKHVRAIMLSRPFLTRVPDQSLVQNSFSGADHIQATRGDDYAFIYAATGRTFTVNMGKISGHTVVAWWFDPRTGRVFRIGEFPNVSGSQEFDPPGAPARGNDWVLVLDDMTKGFPPPGTVETLN